MSEIISWIDMDTLMLLFAMMILVAVIGETGIFDYLSVYAYKVNKFDYFGVECRIKSEETVLSKGNWWANLAPCQHTLPFHGSNFDRFG